MSSLVSPDKTITLKNVFTYLQRLISYLQILKPADKKKFPYGGLNSGRPVTPPRGGQQGKGKKK